VGSEQSRASRGRVRRRGATSKVHVDIGGLKSRRARAPTAPLIGRLSGPSNIRLFGFTVRPVTNRRGCVRSSARSGNRAPLKPSARRRIWRHL